MNKFIKVSSAALIAVILLFVFQLNASAHVSVKPLQSAAGSSETYTLTIPTEKNSPTKKVALQIPANVAFDSYQPVPGWTVKVTKNSSGHVQTVTWTATGAGIAPGAFQQFQFRALNPKKTGNVAWNAYQTYKDGSIVEWTGKEDAETPHATTKIVNSTDTAQTVSSGNQTLPIITLILSAAAFIFSAFALILTLTRKNIDKKSSDLQ
jgi:uncharacterized protein YcnI